MDTENPTSPADKPKPWHFTFSFSYDGPGVPTRAQAVEFLRSLTKRDQAIIGGVIAFIFIIEPLILYWLFSARLKARFDEHSADLRAAVASQIQAEVGPAMREALSQQLRVVTPLNPASANDSTGLVLPSQTPPPPPPPTKSK